MERRKMTETYSRAVIIVSATLAREAARHMAFEKTTG
jgi:hypothetical protein